MDKFTFTTTPDDMAKFVKQRDGTSRAVLAPVRAIAVVFAILVVVVSLVTILTFLPGEPGFPSILVSIVVCAIIVGLFKQALYNIPEPLITGTFSLLMGPQVYVYEAGDVYDTADAPAEPRSDTDVLEQGFDPESAPTGVIVARAWRDQPPIQATADYLFLPDDRKHGLLIPRNQLPNTAIADTLYALVDKSHLSDNEAVAWPPQPALAVHDASMGHEALEVMATSRPYRADSSGVWGTRTRGQEQLVYWSDVVSLLWGNGALWLLERQMWQLKKVAAAKVAPQCSRADFDALLALWSDWLAANPADPE
ncbi:MAG TPA: hypothetical protein VGK19_01220 [Capsulimonadaceae bacterium]|jgi:hypothetical protein